MKSQGFGFSHSPFYPKKKISEKEREDLRKKLDFHSTPHPSDPSKPYEPTNVLHALTLLPNTFGVSLSDAKKVLDQIPKNPDGTIDRAFYIECMIDYSLTLDDD